jgi:1-phosphatidylinositol-4-phosphate 5-kinase
MKWTDGSIYNGQWIRGIQHGQGKMIFPTGIIKEGFFDNNVFKGSAPVIEEDSMNEQDSEEKKKEDT